MKLRLLLCITSLLALHAWAGAEDVKIEARPLFQGTSAGSGIVPILVQVSNSGGDRKGVVRVSSESYTMAYPIDLPKGSRKQLTVYPHITYSPEIRVAVDTDRGFDEVRVKGDFGYSNSLSRVLCISDNMGELGFLRNGGGDRYSAADDQLYVKPELAPSRVSAYLNVNAILLGPGAERITDDTVAALKDYVVAGGTLVFMGGASSPTMEDARWKEFVPARVRLPKMVARSPMLGNFSQEPVSGDFTILDAQPLGPARVEAGRVMVCERSVGLGKTLFFAINLLDPPFSRWPGRRALWTKFVRTIESKRAQGYFAGFTNANGDGEDYYSYSSAGSYYSGSSPYPLPYGETADASGDPFRVTLPRTEKVFYILLAYFILVVPVNFFILKKLKRGELAWVTAPVISLGFAAAFFASSASLYSAREASATTGLLLQQEGFDQQLFAGSSQLFFPRGGSYDLKMPGIETVGSLVGYNVYYGGGGRDSLANLNPQDNGAVQLNNVIVSNLSFREFGYMQVLPVKRYLSISMEGRVATITNVSDVPITGVVVVVKGNALPVKLQTLQPNQMTSVAIPPNLSIPDLTKAQYTDESEFGGIAEALAKKGTIAVKCQIPSFSGNPQVGRQVAGRQYINLVVITNHVYERGSL